MPRKKSARRTKSFDVKAAIAEALDVSPLGSLSFKGQAVATDRIPNLRFRRRKGTRPFSQGDLDRLHDGCIQNANAMCSLVGGYGPKTQDGTQLVNLYNSFAAFLKTFPDTITYPNTPHNRDEWQQAIDAKNRFVSCAETGMKLLLSNLERDVVTLENAVSVLVAARAAFENSPNATHDLNAIHTATGDVLTIGRYLQGYIVVKSAASDQLFRRENTALDKAVTASKVDDIDRIRQEYIQYKFSIVPSRSSFQTIGAPWNSGTYGVAIVSTSVQAAAQRIIAASGTSINSAYRNPAKEMSLPDGHLNSRHCYGDAVDFASSGKDSFLKVAKAACAQGPSWLEPPRMSTYNHVHADWRPGAVPSSYCKSPQDPTGFNAVVSGNTQVRLTWNDHKPSSLDGIKVERSTNGRDFSEIADVNHDIQNYIDPGLAAGTYYYRICAYNDLAGKSGYAPIVTVTVPRHLKSIAISRRVVVS